MSDFITNLDQIQSSQAQKEVVANSLFDAASPAMLYGRRASTTSALSWGYYGGVIRSGSDLVVVENGVVTLDASATNYVEADTETGEVTVNQTEFTEGSRQLYAVVTDATMVTAYTDLRTTDALLVIPTVTAEDVGADPEGTAADLLTAHEAASNPHPIYLTQTEADALYAAAAAITAAVAAHAAAADPHPTYLTQTEGDARYLQTVPSQPFDIHTFYPGVPTASAKLYRGKLARAVAFLGNFSGAQFTATANATASTVFDVQKNGVSVGTCTIAAGTSTPTFASTSGAAVNYSAGDIFSVIGPATPDATLADPAITFAGLR
jgi:hypothetical protein